MTQLTRAWALFKYTNIFENSALQNFQKVDNV